MKITEADRTAALESKSAEYRESLRATERVVDDLYREIRAAHADGLSYRQIAAHVELSHMRVSQIVRGLSAR